MKLKTRILLLTLVPIIILGGLVLFISINRAKEGVYEQAYAGMKATASAVRDIFEIGNEGEYWVDENGDVWKGDSLNISQSVDIVDHVKKSTGRDVTIFWGDNRILTSLTNESGERQINTKASDTVIKKVLEKGETYQAKNVEILGKHYTVCYIPFYQENSSEIVGMVFLGTPQEVIQEIVYSIGFQIVNTVFIVTIILCIIAVLLVNRITKALNKSIHLLDKMADGDLTVYVSKDILERTDEIGMLGKGIVNLRDKLKGIIQTIQDKSHMLDDEASNLNAMSANVLRIMKDVEKASKQMADSCNNQAADAMQASSNVVVMGEMLQDNNVEIKNMNDISEKIRNVSEKTMHELGDLNRDMQNVRESINYLEKQTGLTEDSVEKISSATEIIAVIASQTSLLSLNASIEAARAGDQGKGFAVVAAEIQKLAEQSNTAVDDIRVMVDNLTTNSGNTIECMTGVQDVIEKQEKNIRKTSKVFESVSNGVNESTNSMEAIMEKIEALEEVRTDTVAAVQSSAAISQENAASIEQVMAAIQNIYGEIGHVSQKTTQLGELSAAMKESVHVFSLS